MVGIDWSKVHDRTDRLIVADMLDDDDRPEEARLLREIGQVVVAEGHAYPWSVLWAHRVRRAQESYVIHGRGRRLFVRKKDTALKPVCRILTAAGEGWSGSWHVAVLDDWQLMTVALYGIDLRGLAVGYAF